VLFGGGASGSFRADTWEFDGATWLQRSQELSPTPRGDHIMEYDSGRQRVVLYGGGASAPLTDTWEWDGVTWTQRATTGPAFGRGGGMAFDETRQRIVLLGGGFTSAETWEWDGSTWTRPTTGSPPPARSHPSLAYDPVARRILLFGGQGFDLMYFVNFTYGDTWLYGDLRAPSAAPLGSACAGTSGLPALASDGPYLGAPRFTLELRSARGASPSAFGLSGGTQSQPIGGGCTLYLQAPVAVVLAMTNAAGTASAEFAVPVLASLRGRSLYAQAFVADPQGAAGGLAATAGRRLVIGD
jgi:hypothetical protein